MSIEKTFHRTMRAFGLSPSTPVFLAISGGIDSVVLAHLLQSAGYPAIWLHMNFQLRGEESERDQRFVEQLAGQWGRSLHVKKVDAASFAQRSKLSIQEAARRLRYDWFGQVIQEAGTEAVLLTAHQADDNAETLLMNFLRGTGIKGLTGLPPVNERIHRPLLRVSRAEIEAYAREKDIPFVEDSSNRSTDYTRNQIRLELMPLLRKIYPQADSTLLQNLERFQSVYSVYQQATQRWLRKHVTLQGTAQEVSVALLMRSENRALIHEWLAPVGFTEKQEEELIRLAGSQSGHFIVSPDGRYRIVKHRKHFMLSPVRSEEPETCWIGQEVSSVPFAGGRLDFKPMPGVPNELTASAHTAWLDAEEIKYPLLLREVRPGDYFYPLGLNKKKKLSRFMIDLKLSLPEKEKVWVLESDQRIVWVVGHRLDHRFRVQERTRSTLRIDLLG